MSWTFFAIFNNFCSSKEFVINWRPIGKLFSSLAKGIDIAGMPARLIGTVNISFKYVWTGSFGSFSISKAVEGVDGVKIASTFLKALLKSFFINDLIFWAFI